MKNHFICANEKYAQQYDYVSAPYLRKELILSKFSMAKIRVCGLGFYELFINGKKITKGKFAPYISNPNHLIYYDEYDITNQLQKGGNAIGVILGNGFLNNIGGYPWGFDKADFRRSPILSLVLEVDGEEVLHTDETFKTAPSPIYFDDLRCGEYYDARQEQEGWATYGFDDSTWGNAKKTVAPKGRLVKAEMEPIKVHKEIAPISMKLIDGGFLVDFGINTSGICRFGFKGRCGQKITLKHGELLVENQGLYVKNTATPDFDLNMIQKDIFICSGREDVFEPCFTYHGFRYVFIEGIEPWDMKDVSIVLLQLSSDLQEVGTFSCSNETINKLQQITLNSDRSNFYYFPTDCPQREKNGWTADIALSCEQLLYNFDASKSLSIWLDNVRCAQKENGQLPGVIPTFDFGYEWGNGPAWDIVLVELPYQIYRFTGDMQVLENNAGAIAKYISFLQTKINENGLIAFGLPDWCECGKFSEGDPSTPLEVTDTLVSIELCQKADKIFSILGRAQESDLAREFANQLKRRFREIWLDKDFCIKCRTQTAQAKAIQVGIFTDGESVQAVENLVSIVREDNTYFQVGVIGARVLFRVLADHGYADLALNMMIKDGFPSYKYWLDHGATSLWEAFHEIEQNSVFRKDGGRILSLNHHFWGDVSAWFYRYILGIHINPDLEDCNCIELAPCCLDRVETAQGSYIRNGKGISVERCLRNGIVHLNVKTYGGITCKPSRNINAIITIQEEDRYNTGL